MHSLAERVHGWSIIRIMSASLGAPGAVVCVGHSFPVVGWGKTRQEPPACSTDFLLLYFIRH